MTVPDYQTVIVGAGFAGICAAIKLDKAGLGDYLVIEAGDGPGGTWYWNTYPGIAVDIPSFSYQFSFEQSPRWTRTYAPGSELKAYADHCVARYGLGPKIRFSTKVVSAVFDDHNCLWQIRTDLGGVVTAQFLINASGVLSAPNLPDIDGVDTFAGATMHTARWDHDQNLEGQRVAIIGTGASAVSVIPAIAPTVQHLTVFQRTPIWCIPKFDVSLPRWSRWAMRVPGGMTVQRMLSQTYVELLFTLTAQYFTVFPSAAKRGRALGLKHLRREVKDPVVRDELTPRYAMGCKRPGIHSTYLSAFNRDNVRLVTEPIEKITGAGVATADGESHDVDVLILATGFKPPAIDALPFEIIGSKGQSLSRFWAENRVQAYEGVSMPGFPNYFVVCGPYGYNGASFFALIEAATHHIVRCMSQARRRGAKRVEVTDEANARYFAEMMRKRHTQIFWQDGCAGTKSFYINSHGDIPVRRALTLETYWRHRRFPLDDYTFST
jgi:cation diffusion facilitator CzcD-associated flavoprotein CzcO